MIRPPAFADATSSTGFSRTVTVELLLMRSSCSHRGPDPGDAMRRPRHPARAVVVQKSVPPADTNVLCYEKTRARSNQTADFRPFPTCMLYSATVQLERAIRQSDARPG